MFAMLKRIFLFALVNALILLTINLTFGLLVNFLGIRLPFNETILLYYVFIGFGGALINLAMSRQIAKWGMRVQVIDPHTTNPAERRLVETVHSLARKAQLPAMPEVGYYDSPEVNAFATGPTKARSLVAVSTGLLQQMDADAVEGVLGHEVAHIANGDMVTMTLLQGVVNTLVLVLARMITQLIASQSEERSRSIFMQEALFYILQFALSLLGSILINYFSRIREYRADAGGARLAGRERMLAGLKSLRNVYGQIDEEQQAVATLKISGHAGSTLAALFSTHPPLEERIRRLETQAL